MQQINSILIDFKLVQQNIIIISFVTFMKAQQIIAGRYQYNTLTPLQQNHLFTQYRCYDRVTKKDLLLHILPRDDTLLQTLRDVKHPLVLLVFDVVTLEDGHVAFLLEGGSQATLQEVIFNTQYLTEQDALVIIKHILLGLRELHQKLIVFGRICLENILMCSLSMIKLGYNKYEEQVPLEFQSPEMLKGEKITASSDIYAAGVILYRLIYGVLPFSGDSKGKMVKLIKGKDYNCSYESGISPLKIVVSKEVKYLVQSMLEYYEQNRPTMEQILQNSYMNFPVQTQFAAYLKPKVNLLPQPFIKKYLIYRPSKMLIKYDNYYSENCYLALSTKDKKMVTIYCPEIKMFETEPRKVQSYYEKLRAMQLNYSEESSEFIIKLEDFDKFRQEPIFVTEYCNQGNLHDYLEKRKVSEGWLSERQINMVMYLMAVAIKQMREIGITSIHTIHSLRVMIKNKNIKLRQPGLIAPYIQKRLIEYKQAIDYFAPELKENSEMTQLDKSDMWSYGVLYYYLISRSLPSANEQGQINIQSLQTDQKNRNVIGKCLDYSVQTRLELERIKLQNLDEELLEKMLKEKRENEQKMKELVNLKSEGEEDEEQLKNDRKVMFKNRKVPLFKDYNKIIALSGTTGFRICVKTSVGLIIMLILFFGLFIANGGYGLIRAQYFNPITLQVPFNYGTSLIDMTILTTEGAKIESAYSQYSYQQFTKELRCATNKYSSDAPGVISDFINSTHTLYCLFGFIYLIFFVILYVLYQLRLDLPTVLYIRHQKNENNHLYHLLFMLILMPSLMFCFFYIFAFEYLMQYTPCLGLEDLAYPKFTSIQTLLKGDGAAFMAKVFLTVILWAVLMFLYGFLSLVVRKINAKVYEWKLIIPSLAVMFIYTMICRVGFGQASILSPTWTYKINTDLVLSKYYGLLGLFPEVIFFSIFILDRVIDLVFWYFLKVGLEGGKQQDIKQVKVIQARYEPIDDAKRLDNEKSNIYMIEHDFERFD